MADLVGTVIDGRNNIFRVQTDHGVLTCRLKGKRLEVEERRYSPLAPGDAVTVASIDGENASAVIESRIARRNAFERFNVKRNVPQTLAANVDRAVCVCSYRNPPFRARFVDRFLSLCEHLEVSGAIILNKVDLAREGEREIGARYSALGYPVFEVSATKRIGIDSVIKEIRGTRTVLVGQSGVGKSALLNTLVGRHEQRVGAISSRYVRGRHTTNAGRLVDSGDFELVDTPGIRELDVRVIPEDGLAWCYREIRPLLTECVHSGCTHVNEAGCAVERAAETGTIDPERYESYCRLYLELRDLDVR